MHTTGAILAGLAAASFGMAAIGGKVTTTSGTAIPGALVKLEKGGQAATTGDDGTFSLDAAGIGAWDHHPMPQRPLVTIQGGMLRVHIAQRSVVEIAAFGLDGKTISTERRMLDAGIHSVSLPGSGTGVLLYRVKAGGNTVVLRAARGGGVSRGMCVAPSGSSAKNAPSEQAKTAAPIDDVLAVTKDGFLNYRVIVTNSDTSGIEIKMIVCAGTVTDADGNVYQTVKLGNQIWTVENLRTTKYNDGTPIPHVPGAEWKTIETPGYCFYDNTTNADSAKKYGALYNWYAVNTKKLAPAGWHVPADLEWEALQNYLSANGYTWDGSTTSIPWNRIAKSLSSKTDWNASTVTGAVGNDLRKNNRTGFSAFPAGCRLTSGFFFFIGTDCSWWSATEYDPPYAWLRLLSHEKESFGRNYLFETSGFSVRIVKD